MTLNYPGIGGKPIIIVFVKCLLTDRYFPGVQMLLDTGADDTCFPGSFDSVFGHSNKHPKVEVIPDAVQGIGGCSDVFLHSVRISLLDPVKTTKDKKVIAWSSPYGKAQFVEKLDCPHGLIGMDVMRNWKSVVFEPNKNGIWIRITI